MEENLSMEWKIFSKNMEWKKIASMEYGKILFHCIPYHALPVTTSLSCSTLLHFVIARSFF